MTSVYTVRVQPLSIESAAIEGGHSYSCRYSRKNVVDISVPPQVAVYNGEVVFCKFRKTAAAGPTFDISLHPTTNAGGSEKRNITFFVEERSARKAARLIGEVKVDLKQFCNTATGASVHREVVVNFKMGGVSSSLSFLILMYPAGEHPPPSSFATPRNSSSNSNNQPQQNSHSRRQFVQPSAESPDAATAAASSTAAATPRRSATAAQYSAASAQESPDFQIPKDVEEEMNRIGAEMDELLAIDDTIEQELKRLATLEAALKEQQESAGAARTPGGKPLKPLKLDPELCAVYLPELRAEECALQEVLRSIASGEGKKKSAAATTTATATAESPTETPLTPSPTTSSPQQQQQQQQQDHDRAAALETVHEIKQQLQAAERDLASLEVAQMQRDVTAEVCDTLQAVETLNQLLAEAEAEVATATVTNRGKAAGSTKPATPATAAVASASSRPTKKVKFAPNVAATATASGGKDNGTEDDYSAFSSISDGDSAFNTASADAASSGDNNPPGLQDVYRLILLEHMKIAGVEYTSRAAEAICNGSVPKLPTDDLPLHVSHTLEAAPRTDGSHGGKETSTVGSAASAGAATSVSGGSAVASSDPLGDLFFTPPVPPPSSSSSLPSHQQPRQQTKAPSDHLIDDLFAGPPPIPPRQQQQQQRDQLQPAPVMPSGNYPPQFQQQNMPVYGHQQQQQQYQQQQPNVVTCAGDYSSTGSFPHQQQQQQQQPQWTNNNNATNCSTQQHQGDLFASGSFDSTHRQQSSNVQFAAPIPQQQQQQQNPRDPKFSISKML